MNCKNYQKQIYKYLDGELPPDAAMQFELHIKSCKACELTLANLQAVNKLIEDEKNEFKPNPFITSRVISKLSNEESFSAEPRYTLRYLTIATLAAAGIAIGIMIGSLFASKTTLLENSSSSLAVDQLADEFMPEGDNNPYNYVVTDNEIQTKP